MSISPVSSTTSRALSSRARPGTTPRLALVRPLLGDRVADLVAGYVMAKRYLVTIAGSYRARLSALSTVSLATQGDALETEERARFEESALAGDWIRLRRADGNATVPDADVPDLAYWRPKLESLVSLR